MSGRDLMRRAAVTVLLLGVAGLVLTGLRLTDFDPGGDGPPATLAQGGSPPGDAARAASGSTASGATVRGAAVGEPAGTEETLAVRELLASRAHAVLTGDRKAWSATTPYDRSATTVAQHALYDRLVDLQPVVWRYTDPRVTVAAGETGPPGQRRLAVRYTLAYSLVEGGPEVLREQSATVTGRGGRWWVSDTSGTGTSGTTGGTAAASASGAAPAASGPAAPAVDLWDLTPVVRAVGKRCVVIGAPQRRAWVQWFAARCTASAAKVDAAVPGAADRPARSVLVVPRDVRQLARLLGLSGTAGLPRTAAVTVGRVNAPAEAVLMNAAAFAQLRPVGRRVVLTHELVHVATRADQKADVPTWLDEGLADEIAYRGTGLTPNQIAGPLLRAARAGQLPQALPATEAFDAAGGTADLAYAQAWSAADTVAAEARLGGLTRLHHLVRTGTGLDDALQATVNTDAAGFVSVWQQRVRVLARG